MNFFQYLVYFSKASLPFLLLPGMFLGIPAAANEPTKDEILQLAKTILREASAEIPNLPDENFSLSRPSWIARDKVNLLEEAAKGQGKVRDREGLRATAVRAVRLSQDHDLLLLPLSAIGAAQVQSGFLEDAAITAEGALESLRMHLSRHGMDGDLPMISRTFLRAGKIGKALETAHMIVDERIRAHALRNIGFQEAKNGHEAKARAILAQSQRLMDSLDDPEAKARFAVDGAGHQFELNRKARAAEELARAKTLVQGVTDYDRRAGLCLEIAQLEHKWGMHEPFKESVKKVLQAIEIISEASSRVAQYADFAKQLSQSDHKDLASALLMKARQEVLTVKDLSSKVHAFLFLAEGEWELGRVKVATKLVHRAVDALDEMEDPNNIDGSLWSFFSHTPVLDLITPQDLKRIQQKVERISKDDKQGVRIMAVWRLATLQAQHGYFEQAMETIRQTQGAPSSRGFPIQFFGKEFVQVKGIEEAMIWAKGMPSQAEKIYAHIGIVEGVLNTLDVRGP